MTPNLAESVNVSDENVRDKIRPRTDYEGPGAEKRSSCTLSLTSATQRPLCPPANTTSTHCTGGWFAPGDGLDGCGTSCPHQDLIPTPSSP